MAACHDERCAATEALEVCLTCGFAYCANHRAEQEGLTSCTTCLKEAHEQRKAYEVKKRALTARVAPDPSSASQPRLPSDGPIRVELPPPPVEEAQPWALPWALLAAAPAAGYVWWLLRWLGERHPELPGWLPVAGALLSGLFVTVSVWVIAKSKMSSGPAR